MELIVQDLVKKFGDQFAVDHLSFSIQEGQIVGFLGPNGAGKSTSLKMIAGALKPDSGSILLNGLSIEKNAINFKRSVGYLPESNPQYEDLYVKEYLSFLASIHRIHHPVDRIKKVVDQVGLEKMQHKKIGQLSKGYQQRVGIAGAIIHAPILLLLDEPTAGLDPNQLIEIRNLIKSLSSHTMILFSTHILQEVTAICTNVLVLHQGKLVANKPIETLMATTDHSVIVVFEESIEKYMPQLLAKFTALVAQDKHTLVIQAKSKMQLDEIKQFLLGLALKEGLHIQRLQVQESNLEEIFKLLTH